VNGPAVTITLSGRSMCCWVE